MNILPVCICVHHVHFWGLQRSAEGIGSSGAGVMNGCETPHVALVLHKSSKCSKPPSHLSNPSSVIFRTLNSKEVKKAKKRKT